jgi:hypothetical protein
MVEGERRAVEHADDFERFELEGAGQNCGEVSVCAFPQLAIVNLFLPLSSASHELIFITPIPLNEQSTIEFIK